MITGNPNSLLGKWCKLVDDLKPGSALRCDWEDLMGIDGFVHNGAVFSPADRILENIVGSAYTHNYRVSVDGRTVTFYRFEDTGVRHYMSPDRR